MNSAAKHELVRSYAARYGVLVETGLYAGRGASTALAGTLECYAVDLDYGNVVQARIAGVEAFQGDSAVMLPQLLTRLDRPCCFWLDAHPVTENGGPTPLLAELDAITAWPHAAASTVLVDDLRLFGRDGWPQLRELAAARYLELWAYDARDDVLRLTPLP